MALAACCKRKTSIDDEPACQAPPKYGVAISSLNIFILFAKYIRNVRC